MSQILTGLSSVKEVISNLKLLRHRATTSQIFMCMDWGGKLSTERAEQTVIFITTTGWGVL